MLICCFLQAASSTRESIASYEEEEAIPQFEVNLGIRLHKIKHKNVYVAFVRKREKKELIKY